MAKGQAQVFVGMGGNFASATPDRKFTERALRTCKLTVHVSTKLNRSHLIHGEQALILPCLGRTEIDMQTTGPQSITVEDSMSCVHASSGRNSPASKDLRSEPAVVAGIAKATLKNSPVDWDELVADYSRIRDCIEQVLPAFAGYNEKIQNREDLHCATVLVIANGIRSPGKPTSSYTPFRILPCRMDSFD